MVGEGSDEGPGGVQKHAGESAAQAAENRQLKAAFLGHYRVLGNITAACELAGIGRRARVYEWQEHDEEFARSFQEAGVQSGERLEAEAYRRAVEGVERPVYQQKVLVGTVKEYDTTLLALLMKGHPHLRDKYREKVDVRHNDAPELGDTLSAEQRDAIRRVLIGELR